ncbi:MAG TPA: PAS domain S-box protein [Cyclobacteriaceae bacterium]
MKKSKILRRQNSALIISGIYFSVECLLLLFLFLYVKSSLRDPHQLLLLYQQTIIRFSFVVISSVLLYFLIRYYYKKLQSSEQGYRKLFESNPNPMWVFEVQSLRFLAVNRAAIDKYGYTLQEFLSMTIRDIRPEEEVHRLLKLDWSLTFNKSGIWKHRLKNGKIIHAEVSGHSLDYEGREARLAVANDVTETINYEQEILDFNHTLEKRVNERTRELHEAIQEQATLTEELETSNEELMSTNEQLVEAQEVIQKQSQELVRQSEERLNQVLRSVKDFVWSAQYKEGKFKIDMMSPAVLDILGFTREEYFEDTSLWVNTIAEEDRERVMSLLSDIGDKEYLELEYCIRHPKSWKVKFVLSRLWISTGSEENSFQVNGIVSDISERKKHEEEKSNLIKQLISQNNDLLQFSYIASHNLRGPVATLLGLINLIEKEEKLSDIKAISTHLMFSTLKLDEVIIDLSKILEIRGFQSLPKETVFINEVIDAVRKTLASQFRMHDVEIKINLTLSDSIFTIKSYVHSILYNLISNSIKYRSPERKPVIYISTFKTERAIGFKVSDNGLGIDLEKFQDKLFNLYQRFHTHVDGKGLGLYLVRTQTLALGGEIEVSSKLDESTTFTLSFPIVHEVTVQ